MSYLLLTIIVAVCTAGPLAWYYNRWEYCWGSWHYNRKRIFASTQKWQLPLEPVPPIYVDPTQCKFAMRALVDPKTDKLEVMSFDIISHH